MKVKGAIMITSIVENKIDIRPHVLLTLKLEESSNIILYKGKKIYHTSYDNKKEGIK